ncbi:tetratricopeptide repeat protein [Robiginitomaculum antarcticum]|uniref:tetratricopeptide repeat protein n=1 Tax=Robiginitomaculum antarcticum TaxID=437507 RepID=UPI00035FB73E|nr:hypothetical protein [Robiginitomaculum antarcticum]
MLNRISSIFITFIFTFMLCAQAQAGWVEVRSENFVLRGDLNERDAISLVQDLEGFRYNVLSLYGVTPRPEVVPVPVYTIRDKKTMRSVVGTDNLGGVYNTDLRGPIFLLSSQRGFGRGNEARYIAFHEYSHHLIAAYTGLNFPRWYDEGYANFLATYEQKKGQFDVGAPKQAYGPVLAFKRRYWVPMNIMLSSVRGYPFSFTDGGQSAANGRSLFYAQSWLMAHYIITTDGMSPKFAAYIEALNRGEDGIEAFEKHMGMTVDQFDEIIYRYYKSNRFQKVSYTTDFQPDDVKLTVRKMTKAQGYRHLADVTLAFSGAKRTSAAYDKAEKALGLTAPILVGRADMALASGNYAEAESLIKQALELDPSNMEARRVGGASEIMRYDAGEHTPDSLGLGRKYLSDVLAKYPNDPSANYHYALSYRTDTSPPVEALQAAYNALQYYRSPNYAGSNLNMSQVLFFGGEYEEARRPLVAASVWGPTMRARSAARQMIDEIDRRWDKPNTD